MNPSMQTLAFITAFLLRSSLPFMMLSLLATSSAALALLFVTSVPGKILLLIVLLLALPIAWVSLRIFFDLQIMQKWSESDSEAQCDDFDQGLLALGLIKHTQARDLASRARGCLRLQKIVLALVSVQWIIFMTGVAGSAI